MNHIITKKNLSLLILLLFISASGCSIVQPGATDTPVEKTLVNIDYSSEEGTKALPEPTEPTIAAPTADPSSGVAVHEIDIYAINDLHGKFKDSDGQPGVDELTTYLQIQEMLSDGFILLSSGDMWQGSSESNQTKGALMTEWMNRTHFTSMTVGNHEFDWGTSYISENSQNADFPFLGINVYDKKTNKRVDYLDSSVMVTQNGITFGIIGAIGDCYSSISADKTTDVYFVTGNALTELIKNESRNLRALGADFIILSIHDGYEKSYSGVGHIDAFNLSPYYDLSLSEGYVDLCFEGHTHQAYILQDINNVYHVQCGGDNSTGIAHIHISDESGKPEVTYAEQIDRSVISKNTSSSLIDELLEQYAEEIGDITSVLGHNSVYLNADELRQLCADLYYEVGLERWGSEYDIVLGGGFFSCRSPRCLYAGDVTYEQLQMLFPFDNQIVLCSTTGVNLNNNFFATTNDNYFITYGDYGEYVQADLSPNATYYLVTDTYSSQYAPNHLTVVDTYDADVFARDLLAEYFKKSGK